MLTLMWTIVLALGLPIVSKISSTSIAQIEVRKLFHALALSIFIPVSKCMGGVRLVMWLPGAHILIFMAQGVLVSPAFMRLASGLTLALFILAEYVRIYHISPLGPASKLRF